MKKITLLFSFLILITIFSCQKSRKPNDGTLNPDLVNNPVSAINSDTSKKLPIIKFAEEAFDFGTIHEGQKVHHTFRFKNIGNADLIISNARGSCGCTIPEYNSKPIPPNSDGEIEVTFNSQGKSGTNHKTVTLTTNAIPNTHILNIMGEVKPEGK